MIREIAPGILFGLCIVLVVSCGGSAPANQAAPAPIISPQSTPTPQTELAPETPVAKGTTLSKPFQGITVTLATFHGTPVVEPLRRREPDFEKLTGAHINFTTMPFPDLYQQILTDLSSGRNSYDAFVFDPQWMGDFAASGYLEDLTDRVKNDKDLQWEDIAPFFRDFNSTYKGRVYTVPLDGDYLLVYYRRDLLERDGVKPPETWDDYLAIAKKYQGQDLNGDGKPDYGSCSGTTRRSQGYWIMWAIAGAFLQSQGTGQGAFFNTENMEPLVKNEAFSRALDVYLETTRYAPPDELNMDVVIARDLFISGRCALTFDWGDIGPLSVDPNLSQVKDKVGAVILPGSRQVLDRATGKLVACDSKTCPYAINGVNHAPYSAFGGWSGAINKASKVKDAAYAFLSYMSQPAQSSVDVTIGVTGFNPYRKSHFQNLGPWLASGFSESFAHNYLGAIQDTLNSPNMVLDLRIPQNYYYQGVVLDDAIARYLAGEITKDQAIKQINDGWNKKTDELGRDQQLAAYKATLSIQR